MKRIRKNLELTQAELAEKMMVSVQTISKWECGKTMPDIIQIVPLASILGVTTDCLLGFDCDGKADREKMLARIREIKNGIDNVYARNDDVYYASYKNYKEYLRRYPLDYEVRFLCADSLIRYIYYGNATSEEKDKLYDEASLLLKSLIEYDKDTTRLIDANQMLIILFLYHKDFDNAKKTAAKLPQRGNIRALMELEIYSAKNDQTRCIEISNQICKDAVHDYLRALAVKAKRISLLGNVKKQDAISAWHHLLSAIKLNDTMVDDITIHTKWMYSAFNHLANDYIAVSEIDNAFHVIRELAESLILDYKKCTESGDYVTAEEIKSNFNFYLRSCYNKHFHTDDNIISGDSRFIKCQEMLDAVE